jgi:hypothetical protein
MDISSIAATAAMAQAGQRHQGFTAAAVKQQDAADKAIVAMLDQAAESAASRGGGSRGQALDIIA